MEKLEQLFRIGRLLVKESREQMNDGLLGMKETEERVAGFVNQLGHEMMEQILKGVKEPVTENELWAEGRRGRYNKQTNLRLITRFGKEVVIARRYYRLEGGGGYCPLDEKLGVQGCAGFSPLMSYLLSYFGGSEPYEAGAKKLSEVLGFRVSATMVQGNTERTPGTPPVAIPDFYHASEHLGRFCKQVEQDPGRRRALFGNWRKMLLEGEYVQVLEEMRARRYTAKDGDQAQKELNYFENNTAKGRIDYGRYREEGLPIGSGLVEGSCKFVVGKRFKGSGMRWKKKDNESVLEVRLAILSDTLREHFRPRPHRWRLVA